MSAPDPESLSWIAKLMAPLGAVAAPVIWIHRRLDRKADREDVARCLGHIEKLYSNAEADRKLTRDLHDAAMLEISAGQKQIIDMLSRK